MQGTASRPRHCCSQPAPARENGFTLIELMIVVIIIGVLAGIAYPSYRNYTMQNRRTDARGAMLQIAAQQEKYFTECNRYAATLTGATRSCGTAAGNADTVLAFSTSMPAFDYYNAALAPGIVERNGATSANCSTYACGYSLTFTPKGIQANDGKMMINARGDRFWDRNNNNNYTDAGEDSWRK
jgi:type IV pilus assembly protein PilE